MIRRFKYSRILFLIACVGAFFLIVDRYGNFGELKKALQINTVPTSMLRYGAFGDILRKFGYLKYSVNDYERYAKTDHSDEKKSLETVTFQKKRKVDDYLFMANPGGRIHYRSTAIAKSIKQKKDWPVLSLYINDRDLYDPELGLLPNRAEKGRKWEKIIEVSYLEEGEILFETYVGLRTHGGKRLITRKWKPGFKLYFRENYGLEKVPDGMILKEHIVPLKTLVLQNTVWPPGQPMNNVLAYDISREIGCKVPETRLVEVYINGKSYGMCVAVEHLSRRQWGQRYGHEEYSMFKFRGDDRDIDRKLYYKHFWEPTTAKESFSRDLVAEHIDLDNFSRHLFSWVFNGTEDFCQGVAVFDMLDPEGKISWINWDMDHSFYDRYAFDNGIERENYEQDAFGLIYLNSHFCGRTKLFSKLMNASPRYRQEFLELVIFLINHRLTPDYLRDRLRYYTTMMENFGEPHRSYQKMLEKFMEHRTDIVLDDMVSKFDLAGPYTLSVTSSFPILIDGEQYEPGCFNGHYFSTTPVVLEVNPEFKDRFFYWEVDEKLHRDQKIRLHLSKDSVVKAITKS